MKGPSVIDNQTSEFIGRILKNIVGELEAAQRGSYYAGIQSLPEEA